jgi:cytochrome b pre-mRNA-processing protein 3
MLNVITRSKEHRHAAERLYAAVVTRSREPAFFARLAVPDTLDGRFDLLTLHAWLVLRRYQPNAALAQAFVDRVFVGFDEALREMGAGDMGLGRRMKTFADAFYGRLEAYEAAADVAAMAGALVRNLYRGNATPAAAIVATYVMRAQEHLRTIGEGDVDFGPLPGEDQA